MHTGSTADSKFQEGSMMEIPLDDMKAPTRKLSQQSDTAKREVLYYEIDDNPPWYLSILLGFQVN